MNWKRHSILSHRRLGVLLGLFFAPWFLSGMVMMYARMPRLSPEERLARTPVLQASPADLGPHAAFRAAGLPGPPERARLGMLGGRPVYRFLSADGRWTTVFADDGTTLPLVAPRQAAMAATAFAGGAAVSHVATLSEPDQWTLPRGLDAYRPLHQFRAADEHGTEVYVSSVTGEVVLDTTRRERLLAYLGAIPHWLYVTPLRRHPGLWRTVVIVLSAAGAVVCLVGILVGVWRWSPGRRYRLPAGAAAIPYVGAKRYHHVAGLLFGPVAATWVVSGLLSMNPGRWNPPGEPTEAQGLAVAGGPLDPALFTRTPAEALSALAPDIRPKELELVRFRGAPYYLTRESPSSSLLASAVQGGDGAADRFSREALLAAAREAIPGAQVAEAAWLDDYDAYYYDRRRELPLPVLRVKFDGPGATWLYLDPDTGRIARRYERRSRIYRWLYHGLHSFDFPWLYWRRPAWDVVVLALSLGGAVLSLTALGMSWRRLRRVMAGTLARIRPLGRSTHRAAPSRPAATGAHRGFQSEEVTL